MTGGRDQADAGPAVPGDEHGAHAAASTAGAALGQLADQAAADAAAFDADLALFEGQAIRPAVRRGPGRPAGSPNRSTSKVREYLMARGYRDPMEMQAAIVAADPRELAKALCGPGEEVTFAMALEIVKLQQRSSDALMPYWHQAQPKAVEVKVEGARPLFVFGQMTAPKGEADQELKDVTPKASQIDTPKASQIDGAVEHAQTIDDADIFGVRDHD